jgi:hypothetical protein
MNIEQIQALRQVYQQTNPGWKREIQLLYQYYVHDKEKALLDIAATTAALSAMALADRAGDVQLTPEMEEAFHLQYPNVDLKQVLADGSIADYLNGWKGKYFEVLVRDKLNSGELVGDIQLTEGQVAYLAESPTQPGWDLQIVNADGTVAQELQLKASESLSYIKEALEKYPDIEILTTEEIFQNGGSAIEALHNSGISDQQLEDLLIASASGAAETAVNAVDLLFPGLSIALIATTEGAAVLTGKKTLEMARNDLLSRSVKTGAALGVGAAVHFLDGGLLSIPASLLTRLGMDRMEIYGRLERSTKARTEQFGKLLAAQLPPPRLNAPS